MSTLCLDCNTPVLCASPDLEEDDPPVSLEVIETRACPDGRIFAGYRVVRG